MALPSQIGHRRFSFRFVHAEIGTSFLKLTLDGKAHLGMLSSMVVLQTHPGLQSELKKEQAPPWSELVVHQLPQKQQQRAHASSPVPGLGVESQMRALDWETHYVGGLGWSCCFLSLAGIHQKRNFGYWSHPEIPAGERSWSWTSCPEVCFLSLSLYLFHQ